MSKENLKDPLRPALKYREYTTSAPKFDLDSMSSAVHLRPGAQYRMMLHCYHEGHALGCSGSVQCRSHTMPKR